MRAGFLRDDEAQSRCEERPGHVGEGEEQEGASAPGVDCPDCGPGEDEIYEPEAEGGEQGLQVAGAGLVEDRGAVEGDDVYAAHLLGEHDGEGGSCCTPDAGDGEKFEEAGDVVAAADNVSFFLDLGVDVVKVASCLERRVSETAKRSEGFSIAALFDIPSGRFRAEVYTNEKRKGGQHG